MQIVNAVRPLALQQTFFSHISSTVDIRFGGGSVDWVLVSMAGAMVRIVKRAKSRMQVATTLSTHPSSQDKHSSVRCTWD